MIWKIGLGWGGGWWRSMNRKVVLFWKPRQVIPISNQMLCSLETWPARLLSPAKLHRSLLRIIRKHIGVEEWLIFELIFKEGNDLPWRYVSPCRQANGLYWIVGKNEEVKPVHCGSALNKHPSEIMQLWHTGIEQNALTVTGSRCCLTLALVGVGSPQSCILFPCHESLPICKLSQSSSHTRWGHNFGQHVAWSS